MGNLLRRVLAFVLGMVFTIASASASVVGGAYWAYKNIKPVGIASDDPGLGDLRDQTIEDLMFLLNGAMNNPDKYTLARLEAEYGLDLEKLLKNLGIENVNKDSDNWQALTAISLFSLKDGLPALLSQIKVRALYNFLPSLTGKRLKDLLSPEAQEKLGDYTLMELFESDEETGETGIIKALKNIKLGALLPAYFDGEFDEVNHEYNYVLADNEEAQALPVLEVFGNVSLGVISSLISGGDIMAELMEGSLSSISEMPIEDIISSIAKTVSPELGEKITSYAKFLNGARIKDLFYKNDGKWEFYYAKVLGNLKVGYLFGLEENEEGVWVDKDGKPAKDLMQVLAGLDINTLVSGNDTFTMIRDLIGDVNIGMVLDMLGIEEGEIPFMDAIRGIQVGELLKNQGAEFDANVFVKDFIANLADSLGDRTLGELIFKKGEEPTDANAIVKALFNLRLSDFIKEEYTLESVIAALRNALGDVSVGDVLGIKRNSDGTWNTDDKVLALILDFSFDNIFDVLTSDYSAKEVIKKLFPETKVGDLVCAFMGFEVNEENGRYYKENDGEKKYLSNELSELFDCKIADLAAGLLDRGDPFDSYEQLAKPMLGDLIDFVATWLGTDIKELNYVVNENGDGEYEWEGEPVDAETPVGATSRLLSTSVAEFVKDIANGGSDLISKDIEEYISIAGALVRFIAKSGGYTGDIDGMTKSVVDLGCYLFDGKLYGFGLNYYAKIPVLADLSKTVAEKFIPAGTALNTVSQLFDEIGKLYENSVIDTVLADTMALEVDGIVSALGEIVKKATPDNAEKVAHIVTLVRELIVGQVSGFGLDYSAKISTLAEESKTIADDYLLDGTAKNIVDELFGQIGVLYPETTLDTFVEDTAVIGVNNVISSLGEIVKKGTPDNAEKVAHVTDLINYVITGELSGFGIDYYAEITGISDRARLIAYDYVSDGKAKDVVNAVFDEINALYPTSTIDSFVADTSEISFDTAIEALSRILKVSLPDYEEQLDAITKLVVLVLDGRVVRPGWDLRVLMDDVIVATGDVVKSFWKAGAKKIDAIVALATLVVDGKLGYPCLDLRPEMDEVIVTAGTVVKAFWEDGEEQIDAIVNLATMLVDGKLSYPCIDLRNDVDDVIIAVADVIKSFWKDGEKKIDAIVDLATMVVDGRLSFPVWDLHHRIDDVIVVAGDVVKAFWEDGSSKADAVVNLLTVLLDGKAYRPGWDLTVYVTDVTAAVDKVLTEFGLDKSAPEVYKYIDVIFNELDTLYEGVKLKYFVSATVNAEFDIAVDLAVRLVHAFYPAGDKYAEPIGEFVKLIIGGKVGRPMVDLTVYVTEVTASLRNILAAFGYKLTDDDYVSTVLAEVDSLYEGKKLKHFVAASANLEFDAVVNSFVNIAVRVMQDVYPDGIKYVKSIEQFVTLLIGGKISRPMFDLTIYVTEVTASVRNLLTTFVFTEYAPETENYAAGGIALLADTTEGTQPDGVYGYIDAVFNEIDSLYAGVKLKHFVRASANLEFDAVVDSVANIATKVLNDVYPDGVKYIEPVTTFVKVLIGGKISAPMLDLTAKVNEVTDSLCALIDTFVPQNDITDIITDILDEIGRQYHGVMLKDFASSTLSADFDKAVVTLADIAKIAWPDGAKYIDAVANFLITMIDGKVCEPKLDLTVTVDEVIDRINELLDVLEVKGTAREIIDFAFNEILSFYSGVTLQGIPEKSKSIEFDDVVDSVVRIIVKIAPEQEENVKPIAELVKLLIGGPVISPKLDLTVYVNDVTDRLYNVILIFKLGDDLNGKINVVLSGFGDLYNNVRLKDFVEATKDLYVARVIEYVESVTNAFGLKSEILDTIYTELKDLYKDAQIRYFVDETLNLDIDETIMSLATIVKSFKAVGDDKVDAITNLATMLLKGTVGKPEIDKDVIIVELADAFDNFYSLIIEGHVEVLDNVINELITQVKTLYPNSSNTIGTFVDDSLNLDVDVVIESVRKVFAHIEATSKITDRIAKLASAALDGTLGDLKFNLDAFLEEATTTEILIIGGVILVTGTILYFVANETLIKIVDAVLGKDCKLGTLIAEPMGYTVDGETYTFEGKENDLANTLFNLTVQNVLTKGFDFKSVFEDKLYIDDIAMMAKAVESKYAPDEVKSIADVALDVIADLYNETHVKDFVSATVGMETSAAFGGVAKIVNAATKNKYEEIVNAIEKLLSDAIGGKFNALELPNRQTTVDELVSDIEGVTNAFDFKNAILTEVYEQLCKLYQGELLIYFVDVTCNLELDAVIGSTGEIVKSTEVLTGETIDTIVDLAQYLVDGIVSKPEFNMDAEIAEIARKLNAVTDRFELGTAEDWVDFVLEQVAVLFPTSTIKTVGKDVANIELDAIIDTLGAAVETANLLTEETVDTIVDFAQYLAEGTVSKPGFNMDAEIAEIAKKLNAITDRFELGAATAYVECVFEQVTVLFPTTTIKTFVNDAKELELDAVIGSAAEIFKVTELLTGETVDTIIDLAQYLAEGTVSKPGFNMDAEIAEIAKKLNAITDRFELGAADAWVDFVFEQVAVLFPTSTIKTVGKDAANIELDAIVDTLGAAIVTAELLTSETVDTITDLAKYLAEGTVSKPGFNMDAEIAEITKKLNAITDRFELGAADAWVDLILEQIAKLFPTSTIKTFAKDAAKIELDAVVDTFGEAIKTAELLTDETVDTITDLAKYLAEGTVSKPGFNMDAEIAEITKKLNAITDRFELGAADAWVDLILEQIAKLFPTSTIKTFAKDAAKIELDAVVDTFGEAIKTAELLTDETVDTITDLAKYLAEGTVSKPGFNMDAEIAEITKKLNAITDRFELGAADAWVDLILEQIAKLFPTSTIKTFAKDAAKIELDAVVDTFGEAIKTAELLTDKTVDTITDLAKYLAEGTVSKPGFNMDAEIAVIAEKVNAVTDRFKLGAAKAWVDVVLEQVGVLFPTSTIKTVAKDAANIELDNIITAVANIVKTGKFTKDAIIDAIADLAKELVDGTIKSPKLNSDALVNDVAAKLTAIIDEIEMNANLKKALKAVIDGIGELYDGVKVKDFVAETMNRSLDSIIDYIEKVVVAAFDGDTTEARGRRFAARTTDNKSIIRKVNVICDLLRLLADGTVKAPAIDKEITVDQVVNSLKAVTDEFALKHEILTAVYTEIAALYENAKVVKFVDATLALELDNVITAVANIIKSIKFVGDDKVDAVSALAKVLAAGTIKAPKLDDNAKIIEIADAFDKLYSLIVEGKVELLDNIINEIIAQVNGLYTSETTIKSFVADSKKLDVDETIESVRKVFAHIEAISKVTDRIATLASAALKGTFAELEFEFDELMKVATTTEKIIGGAIVLGVGTVLYFVANETLLSITDKALGPDRTIGSLCAEYLGYTVADDKYTFEDEENELANTLFTLKVHDALTKGYDFKARFEDKLYIDDIALFAKAIESKYAPDDIKSIVNVVLDVIADLYDETHVKDFVSATVEMEITKVFNAVASIVNAATKDAYKNKVDAIVALLCDVIVGKLSAPEVPNKELLITEAVADVENITDAFDLKYNALTEAYNQLKKLYEGKKVVDFVDATKELAIDDVIGSTGEVTKASKVVKEAIVNDIVDLAQYVLTGKVVKPQFSGKAKIAEIANKVKTFVNEFNLGAAKEWIDCILDQVGVLLPTATIRTFVSEVKEIELDAVIYSAGEIFKVSKLRTAKTVDAYVDFVQYIVTGKVVKPQFDGDAQIAEIANKAKAIAARYKLGKAKEWIDCVLDEIGVLLPTAIIRTVKDDVKEIEIDAVIGSAGEIFKVSKLLKDLTVDTITDLAQYIVTGKVVKPQFDGDAQIAEIANKVKAVINRFDFNSPKGIILCTLDQIGVLLPTATIRTVKDDVLNIELDALLEATGNVVKYPVFIKDELVETIVVLAQELADGTIRSPKFNSAAYVETVADEVNAIIDTFEVNNTAVKVVKAIIGGLGDLYTGVQLKDFVTETMNRSLDGIIDYLEEVIVTALGGETSTQSRRLAKAAKNNSSVIAKVNVICDLLRLIADGTVKSPAVDKNVTVDETVEKVQAVTDEFKAKHAVLTAVYEELKVLYNGAKLVKIADATLALELDNVIGSLAAIVKSTKVTGEDKINAIADLAILLVAGTIKAPAFDTDAKVVEIANAVDGIYSLFVEGKVQLLDDVINELFAQINALYASETTLKSFVADSKKLDIDDTIESVRKVFEHIDAIKSITDRIAKLASVTFDGTFEKYTSDMNALMNEATTTEKIIGGAIILGAGTLLYFVANPTLLKITDKALGPDRTIGSLIAEHLGYTVNGDKYTFEDEENELANALFTLKVHDALTKGYDFKARFEDKLYVDDIAMIAKAIESKYLPADVKSIADIALDVIAETYDEIHVKDFVSATVGMEMSKVFHAVAMVVNAATKDEYKDKVDAIEKLLGDVIVGKISAPEVPNKELLISETVTDVKNITNAFDFKYDALTEAYNQLKSLYEDKKLTETVDATKELEIDAVLGSAGEVIKASKVLKAGTLNAVVDLAQYVLTGKVVKPQFSGKAQIAEIANKTKLIANRFDLGKAKPWVDCVLDQVGVLLPTAKIKTVGKEIKEIEIDAVIEVAGNIFKTADLCKDETVNAFVELVQYIVTGKVVKPQFDGDAEIAEIANKAKTAANRFDLGKAKPWVDCVLDQVGVLLPTATIRTFVGEVKEIEIDTVIYSAGEIFKVSKLRTATTVDKYVDFAQYILTGKVVKPQFDGDAQIAEIANKAKTIAKRYKLGKAQTWVEFVLDQVGVLFPTSIIRTVGKDVKEIEIDAIIDVAGNALKTAKVYKDGTIDTITDLAKYIVTGKVVKPQFDGDAQIAEIANKANAVVNRFKFGKAKPWINCVLDEIGTLYEQATLKSFVESSKNIELQKLLASVKAITGVAKGLNDKLAFIYKVLEASLSGTIAKPGFDFAKAFSMLSNTEKSIVIGIGTALVITMYYFANPLFVKIASKVFKENETWGDRFAKSLGYAFDETQNRYMRTDDLYNALVDTWLGMKIVESLKTEYKIIDKLSAYITIGNIITSYKDFQAGIEKGMMKGASFYAEGDKWMICRLSFDHLEDIVLNTSLKEILDNKKSLKTLLFNKIDSLTIADFGVGSFIRVYGKGSKIKGFKATAEYDAATEKWAFGGSFNELFDVLLNCTIGDMRQIKQKYGSFKNYVLGGSELLVVGDVLGYAINMANEMSNNKLKITAAKDATNGWTVEGKYAQVLDRFVNINLKELYDNLKSNMKDYISSEKLVGGIRIGELLDGGYNVYDTTTDKWSNKKGEMTFKSGLYGMLIKKIYTIQLGEFMTGKGYNISKLTEDTYLGDVFKFTCDHNGEIGHKHTELCKWFETKSVKTAAGEASVEMLLEVDAVYGALSSMSLNDLIDGEDVLVNIKKLTLGDMMGYVKEIKATGEYTYYEVLKDGGVPVVEVVDGYAYKRAGEKVSKLTGTLAKVKVDTLMSGEGVDEIMNEIEKLQLGDILRYTYDESASVWKDGETEITGILAAFCDHTLAELKDPDKLKDIVNDLKLKDVLGEDVVNGNAVLVHLGDTKIGKLSERINNMYIGEVLEYSSTVKKHGEYDIYTDSNSVEYYNDSAMSEGGVFAGYWKKVEDGVEDYTISKEPDTVTGRYKSTDDRYLSLAHTWKKTEADGSTTEVTGVTAVLANFRISELDDPDFNTRLDSAIDNMKLGNFIAIDNDSPVILKELANTKLKDVSEQIELIKVGTLMGYAYNEGDGKWYNGGSALTDSFTIKLANHTIKEVSSGSFSDILAEDFKTIKVSKVMAKSDCTLFAIMSDSEYNELTIDNMGGKLNDKLANVTLGDAVTIGVLDGTLFNTKGDAIRIAYNAASGSTYGTWNEIPAKQFLTYAIGKAFENV